MEALSLRTKDLEFTRRELIVRSGKGGKDRVTVLPAALLMPLKQHLAALHRWYERERLEGGPGVSMPRALKRKYPAAALSWSWLYIFPSATAVGILMTAAPFGTTYIRKPCSGPSSRQ